MSLSKVSSMFETVHTAFQLSKIVCLFVLQFVVKTKDYNGSRADDFLIWHLLLK